MLTNNNPVSFIATCDKAASRLFYEDSLGLQLIADEHFALVFNLNGHILRISKVEVLLPAKYTVLGWHVDNIEKTVKKLVSKRVVFEIYKDMQQDEFGIWVSPSGAKVAWFKDPDGNNLSITQLKDDSATG